MRTRARHPARLSAACAQRARACAIGVVADAGEVAAEHDLADDFVELVLDRLRFLGRRRVELSAIDFSCSSGAAARAVESAYLRSATAIACADVDRGIDLARRLVDLVVAALRSRVARSAYAFSGSPSARVLLRERLRARELRAIAGA